MVHQTAFFKILGISTKVAEPTPYHLLGIDPREFSHEQVEDSLEERKRLLRQNIPGPQFIPIVSLWERELDGAAEVLLDDDQRRELNERLIQEIRDKKAKKAKAKRERLKRAINKLIDDATDASGALPDEHRPLLAQELSKLDLSNDQVEAILAEIPSPAQQEVAEQDAIQYFTKAAGSAVVDGAIAADDQRKLMKLAKKLSIARPEAAKMIQRAAEAPQPRPHAPRRKRPAAQDARGSVADSLAAELDQLAETQPKRPLTRAPRRKHPAGVADNVKELAAALGLPSDKIKTATLQKIAAVAIPVAAIAIFLLMVMWKGQETPRPRRHAERKVKPRTAPAQSKPLAAGAPDEEQPEVDPVVLAVQIEAMRATNTPEQVQAIVERVDPKQLLPALGEVVDLLTQEPGSIASCLAERAARRLMAMRLPPAAQNLLVNGLIRAARGETDEAKASCFGQMLSQALYLRPLGPDFASDRPAALAKWERDWRTSIQQHPEDPLNDPARILAAVMAGGDLKTYASRVGDEQRQQFVDSVLQIAQGQSAQSAQAQSLVKRIAVDKTLGFGPARKAAQGVFVEKLRSATDYASAKSAYDVLADALDLHTRPKSSALATPAGRQDLADQLAVMVKAEEGQRPAAAAFQATTATTTAEQVRQAFTTKRDGRDAMLADVALAMLACCDRAMLFAAGYSPCSQDLDALASDPDRTNRLAGKVTLPPPRTTDDNEAEAAAPAVLDAKRLAQLKQDLQSDDDGARYKAIDDLRRADTDEAAKALLAEFRRRAAGDTDITIPDPAIVTECRILHALGDMRAEAATKGMHEMITQVNVPYFAYELTRQLYRLHSDPARKRKLLLPLKNTAQQRKVCQWDWGITLRPATTSRQWRRRTRTTAQPSTSAEAWQPFETQRKLAAAITYYAAGAADALKQRKWALNTRAELEALANTILASDKEGQAMLAALDAVVVELARLVRQHPRGKDFATTADMVELEKKARALASDTMMQKAVVAVDAAGGLLELLIREIDTDGERAAKLDKILADRKMARLAANNALHELRESAFYNLLLWDLILAPEEKPDGEAAAQDE